METKSKSAGVKVKESGATVTAVVWLLRVVIGGTFVISGWAKCDDIWGTVIKIGEYLTAWGIEMPRAIVVAGAVGLAATEGVSGVLLLTGCYRRTVTWVMAAMMAVMLPLTAYIALYSPVSDCGCFGDFLVLSNTATFWKNVALTAGIVFLLKYNAKVAAGYHSYGQWIIGALASAYFLIISGIGFTMQPLVDFRSFQTGSLLSGDGGEAEDEGAIYEFVYERDGEQKSFGVDNLPDSTWTFVDRRLVSGSETTVKDGLTLLDDGEDVTADVIDGEGRLMLITIPDPEEAGYGYSTMIDDLAGTVESAPCGGRVAIVVGDAEAEGKWEQILGEGYEVYSAEATTLKELVRGDAGAVYTEDGKVVWKNSLDAVDASGDRHSCRLGELAPWGEWMMVTITVLFAAMLGIILIADHGGMLVFKGLRKWRKRAGKRE